MQHRRNYSEYQMNNRRSVAATTPSIVDNRPAMRQMKSGQALHAELEMKAKELEELLAAYKLQNSLRRTEDRGDRDRTGGDRTPEIVEKRVVEVSNPNKSVETGGGRGGFYEMYARRREEKLREDYWRPERRREEAKMTNLREKLDRSLEELKNTAPLSPLQLKCIQSENEEEEDDEEEEFYRKVHVQYKEEYTRSFNGSPLSDNLSVNSQLRIGSSLPSQPAPRPTGKPPSSPGTGIKSKNPCRMGLLPPSQTTNINNPSKLPSPSSSSNKANTIEHSSSHFHHSTNKSISSTKEVLKTAGISIGRSSGHLSNKSISLDPSGKDEQVVSQLSSASNSRALISLPPEKTAAEFSGEDTPRSTASARSAARFASFSSNHHEPPSNKDLSKGFKRFLNFGRKSRGGGGGGDRECGSSIVLEAPSPQHELARGFNGGRRSMDTPRGLPQANMLLPPQIVLANRDQPSKNSSITTRISSSLKPKQEQAQTPGRGARSLFSLSTFRHKQGGGVF